MNDIVALLRLQEAWRECERHVYHMFHAMTSIHSFWPVTGELYANFADAQVQDIDQFILRFTKLQDTMGNRLFPAILRYLSEPIEDRSMLDKLNRLEKLGFISSVNNWQIIRNIRNKFAHDYPDDPDKNAAQLNFALEAAISLYVMLAAINIKLTADYPLLELDKSLPDLPEAWTRQLHECT